MEEEWKTGVQKKKENGGVYMKVRKVLATVLVSTFVLAACSGGNGSGDSAGNGEGSTAPVAFNTVFSTD